MSSYEFALVKALVERYFYFQRLEGEKWERTKKEREEWEEYYQRQKRLRAQGLEKLRSERDANQKNSFISKLNM